MTTINLRLPKSLLTALDQTAEGIYTNRSALIRQSIARNLFIINHLERPAIREHYKNQIPTIHMNPGDNHHDPIT